MNRWTIFQNYNFFIVRSKSYNSVGRNQTELEAIQLDNQIYDIIQKYSTGFDIITGDKNAPKKILETLDL